MKYKIDINEFGIDIHINDVKEKKEQLLEAFQDCQQGKCSCPTDEYKKLDSLEIDDNDQQISLHLKSKIGSNIDIDIEEIKKCMAYTTTKTKQDHE